MLVTLSLTVLLSSNCLFDDPDRPPPLNFDKPVDYVAWYNGFVSKGKGQNAAELYKGLFPDADFKGGIPKPSEATAKEMSDLYYGPVWDPNEHPGLIEYLAECGPYLRTVKKGVKRRDFWQPGPTGTEKMIDIVMPHLSSSRHAVKAMIVLSWMKQEDQASAMLDAWETCLRHAQHIQNGGMLISTLVGIAERALVYNAVQAAVNEGIIRDKALIDAIRMLQRSDDSPHSTTWVMIEWATVLDTLQFLCPGGKLHPERGRTLFTRPGGQPSSPKPFDPKATSRMIDDYFEGFARIVSDPLTGKNTQRLKTYCQKRQESFADNPFLTMFLPGLSRAYELIVRTETERRGTLLTLAVHAYHAKHGKWPASLDDLAVADLKALRIDPYSQEDFVYKVKDGRPVLYSIGADGKDDGGRHDRKWGESPGGGDYVFWPYQRQ